MSFTARYPGVCSYCDEEFAKGTPITFNEDDDVVHATCPTEVAESLTAGGTILRKPKALCPYCFLELPTSGVCECRE